MDFKGVNCVINYDFPQSVISYVHRIGRTGRAGRPGEAITFFTESDMTMLRYVKKINCLKVEISVFWIIFTILVVIIVIILFLIVHFFFFQCHFLCYTIIFQKNENPKTSIYLTFFISFFSLLYTCVRFFNFFVLKIDSKCNEVIWMRCTGLDVDNEKIKTQ